MPDTQPAIAVNNLTAGYGSDIILDRISFTVARAERLVILGGSGCGKSTLLKHLIGLIPPLAGTILIDGVDITSCSEQEFRQVKKNIGVLFQSGALFGSMTLAENIALPLEEYTDLSRDHITALVKMKLALVNLAGYENHLPAEVSGGMKKRAGLARALALNPKILFFDEPSAGLDPITSAELDQTILHINRSLGTTMVIVTHELDSIFTIGQKIIMLDKRSKGIIAQGDPQDLKENSRNIFVRQFFNREIGKMGTSVVG